MNNSNCIDFRGTQNNFGISTGHFEKRFVPLACSPLGSKIEMKIDSKMDLRIELKMGFRIGSKDSRRSEKEKTRNDWKIRNAWRTL
jgi:hypothetical protein